jgi:hypothetical protein
MTLLHILGMRVQGLSNVIEHKRRQQPNYNESGIDLFWRSIKEMAELGPSAYLIWECLY